MSEGKSIVKEEKKKLEGGKEMMRETWREWVKEKGIPVEYNSLLMMPQVVVNLGEKLIKKFCQ